MYEVKKIFLANFQILGPLGCQGWVVIPQNVKKSKNHCTLVYSNTQKRYTSVRYEQNTGKRFARFFYTNWSMPQLLLSRRWNNYLCFSRDDVFLNYKRKFADQTD